MIPRAFPMQLLPEGQKALERIQQLTQGQDHHLPSLYPKLDDEAFPGWTLFGPQEWASKPCSGHNPDV